MKRNLTLLLLLLVLAGYGGTGDASDGLLMITFVLVIIALILGIDFVIHNFNRGLKLVREFHWFRKKPQEDPAEKESNSTDTLIPAGFSGSSC